MSLGTLARRLSARALGLVVVLGPGGSALASDVAPAPLPAAPAVVGHAAPCPTCAPPPATCASCTGPKTGHALLGRIGHRNKAPYETYLCPGACFGYFQTRWSRWEDVCPLPYQGTGLSDAPPPHPGYVPPVPQPSPPTGADPRKPRDGELPAPRPADPPKQPGSSRSAPLPPLPIPVPSATSTGPTSFVR
jgi:hypothetical protein